jgi:hypothetical protein
VCLPSSRDFLNNNGLRWTSARSKELKSVDLSFKLENNRARTNSEKKSAAVFFSKRTENVLFLSSCCKCSSCSSFLAGHTEQDEAGRISLDSILSSGPTSTPRDNR